MTLLHSDPTTTRAPGALPPVSPRLKVGAVDPTLYDCLAVNLAVLAQAHHGAVAASAAGAELRFAARTTASGLPTVEPTVSQHLRTARTALGMTLLDDSRVNARDLAGAPAGTPVYVVADAFHLPWVPYHGHRHMEHSFLLWFGAGGAAVADAYHNETPWGPARPLVRRFEVDELLAALPAGLRVVQLAAGPAPEPGEATLSGFDAAAIDSYADAYADHADRLAALDRLTLETWLLARQRRLHAAYRAAVGSAPPAAEVTEHLRAWSALAEAVFLAERRVRRGRAEPAGLSDRLRALLHRDRELFGRPAGTGVSDPVREVVTRAVADVLGVPVAALPGADLTALPSFTSFSVVEIVERIERDLDVEFDAADMVPERLHRVDALGAAAQRALDARDGIAGARA
ncbi:acyl carrier protein [Micromonospora sp. NPDC047074]|uniref:acyl carrier protein n=1 Tax=Micromonospora sp. NPDC047074 TaxID=3154339 RepID=UPI0033E18809